MLVSRGLFSKSWAGVRFKAARVLLMASLVGARMVHAVVSFRELARPERQQEWGTRGRQHGQNMRGIGGQVT
jgi:hypothetical protein